MRVLGYRLVVVVALLCWFALEIEGRPEPGVRSWWHNKVQNVRNRVNDTFKQLRNETSHISNRLHEEVELASSKAHNITKSVTNDVHEGTQKVKARINGEVEKYIRAPSRKGLAAICSNPLAPLPEEVLVRLCREYWSQHGGRPIPPVDTDPPPPAEWDPNPTDMDDPYPSSRASGSAAKSQDIADPDYDPFGSYKAKSRVSKDYSEYNDTDWESLLAKVEQQDDALKPEEQENRADSSASVNLSTMAWVLIALCLVGLVSITALFVHRVRRQGPPAYTRQAA